MAVSFLTLALSDGVVRDLEREANSQGRDLASFVTNLLTAYASGPRAATSEAELAYWRSVFADFRSFAVELLISDDQLLQKLQQRFVELLEGPS